MIRYLAAALALITLATFPGASESRATPRPSGTVSITAGQVSFILGGQGGHGVLHFRGHSYGFRIGGLGVGGIGISRFSARGEIYQLHRVPDFFGKYVSARVGWAAGEAGRGQMWLRNPRGVVIHLFAQRRGLMLSMGADAIQISPD